MSDQPKPTGEWMVVVQDTPSRRSVAIMCGSIEVARFPVHDSITELTELVIKTKDAHNAALDAEREKVQTLVDALTTIRRTTLPLQTIVVVDGRETCLHDFIDSTLGKLKEGK